MNLILYIIVVLNSVVAILALVAKLKWSKEFSLAKDQIIKSKDAQIGELSSRINSLKDANQDLKDLSPMKLKEWVKTSTGLLEEYNDSLQSSIDALKSENNKLKSFIQYIVQEHIFEISETLQKCNTSINNKLKKNKLTLEEITSQIYKLSSKRVKKNYDVKKLTEEKIKLENLTISLESRLDDLKKYYEIIGNIRKYQISDE